MRSSWDDVFCVGMGTSRGRVSCLVDVVDESPPPVGGGRLKSKGGIVLGVGRRRIDPRLLGALDLGHPAVVDDELDDAVAQGLYLFLHDAQPWGRGVGLGGQEGFT